MWTIDCSYVICVYVSGSDDFMYQLLRKFGTYGYIQRDTALLTRRQKSSFAMTVYVTVVSYCVSCSEKLFPDLSFWFIQRLDYGMHSSGFEFHQRHEICLYFQESRPNLGPHRMLYKMGTGVCYKWQSAQGATSTVRLHAIPKPSWHEQRRLYFTLFNDAVQSKRMYIFI